MIHELVLTLSFLASAAAAQEPGVSVAFQPRMVAAAQRTPQGELKAILEATATLTTERPIRYRSVVLPPGTYPIAIAADEGRQGNQNLYFVIGPAPAVKGQAPEEKRSEEKVEEPKRGARPAPGRGTSRKPDSGRRAEAGDAPEEAQPDPARPAGKTGSGQIKAIFHLTAAPKSTEAVEFSVRPIARGGRFSLTVRAGSSQGKATIRFAD